MPIDRDEAIAMAKAVRAYVTPVHDGRHIIEVDTQGLHDIVNAAYAKGIDDCIEVGAMNGTTVQCEAHMRQLKEQQ